MPRRKGITVPLTLISFSVHIEDTIRFSKRGCYKLTAVSFVRQPTQIKFFGLSSADVVITVEKDWYERIRNTTLYRYRFPNESFELFDEIAGYYISLRMQKADFKNFGVETALKGAESWRTNGEFHPIKRSGNSCLRRRQAN
ncbi:DUF6886 family protein [Paenibacillus terreus]